jgi:uncharacterized membrane protein
MITKRLLLLAVSAVVLGAIFTATSPDRLPAAIFVLVFAMLFLLIFLSISIVCIVLKRSGLVGWDKSRIQRVAGLLAALPVFLLSLQSIGQLTLKDVLLTSGLLMLLYFYFNRLAAQNRS